MLTKKQKNTLLYILFVFILCSAAMDFEFLVLKTDETFLAENIFCKLFALLMIYLCLEDRKLTWRSIGLRRSGITKGMILGFSIGIITFTASYLVEFILLLILGKSPKPGFTSPVFPDQPDSHQTYRLSDPYLHCRKYHKCTGGGRPFQRAFLQAGPPRPFRKIRQPAPGAAF